VKSWQNPNLLLIKPTMINHDPITNHDYSMVFDIFPLNIPKCHWCQACGVNEAVISAGRELVLGLSCNIAVG